MRIMVTGGAGFIGSHIVDALIADGHSVLIVDDFSTGRRENLNKEAAFGLIDITRFEDLETFVGYFRPTHICHQAAQASLLRSEQHPDLDAHINILGTLNVIKLAQEFNARVVMASTSAVYAPSRDWVTEESPCAPNRPYGISKYAAERYLEWSGLSYAILRYGNVYGPRQRPVGENQLIPRALDHLLLDKPFQVYGSGLNSRDFVYVGDIARANLMALQSDKCGIFNAGTGITTCVNTVLSDLLRLTDQTYNRTFEHVEGKRGEPEYVNLCHWKSRDVLGWMEETPLEKGLEKTIAWYRETYQ